MCFGEKKIFFFFACPLLGLGTPWGTPRRLAAAVPLRFASLYIVRRFGNFARFLEILLNFTKLFVSQNRLMPLFSDTIAFSGAADAAHPPPPPTPSPSLVVVCPIRPCLTRDCPLLHVHPSITLTNAVPIPANSYENELRRRGLTSPLQWLNSDPMLENNYRLHRINLSLAYKVNVRQQRAVLAILFDEYSVEARVVYVSKDAKCFRWGFGGACPFHHYVHGSNHWTVCMYNNNDEWCLFFCPHGDIKRKMTHLPLDYN